MGATIYGIGLGLNVIGTLEKGQEEKRRAYYAAEETMKESAYLQRMGMEELHELEVEKGEAVGAARARGAKAGIRAGGSAGTLLNKIRGRYRRKQERISKEISFRTGALGRKARELRRRGKAAEEASRWDVVSIGLGAGYKLGSKYPKEGPLFG